MMNTLLLTPSDVLFFRDGRPMGGSLSGHGAAWPLPTVTSAALHAALWRSGLAAEGHGHSRKAKERWPGERNRPERFGSLVTAGPYPVFKDGESASWHFPAPEDARLDETDCEKAAVHSSVTLVAQPVSAQSVPGSDSSNPLPFSVASAVPPSKDRRAAWWSAEAWESYTGHSVDSQKIRGKRDADIFGAEATIGIGVSPETGAQDGKSLYSAHYLRLREGWNLGLLAETAEKFEDPALRGQRADLIQKLIPATGSLIVGGQQRVCSVTRETRSALPLPRGRREGFAQHPLPGIGEAHLVKWTLLSPSIWPAIPEGKSAKGSPILAHRGGWLPNWVRDDAEFRVMLKCPLEARDLGTQSREAYRNAVRDQPAIAARLVAALVPKPIPVTGWGLGTPDNPEAETREAFARPVYLAVPAGAVYYFACASAKDAADLAAALNWHGTATSPTTLRNRRSTLFGEKGFGIGVCGTWLPHDVR